jgi:NitT/TauT family transport system substrate-binding protein
MSRIHVRKLRNLLALAAAIPVMVSACGNSSPAPKASAAAANSGGGLAPGDPTSIKVIVTNSTGNFVIPWLVGEKQGFFQQHGVVVSGIVNAAGGIASLQTMLSGGIPIGEIGFPAVVQGAARGLPIVAVGGATQSLFGANFYTLATNSKVKAIGDIKTRGYPNAGSVVQALTYLLPQKAGLPAAGVQRVATGTIGNGAALLEAGKIDVAALPFTVPAATPGKFRLVVDTSKVLNPFQQSVITVTSAFEKAHPAVVKAVLAGYEQAVNWIKSNIQTAAGYYAASSQLSASLALETVQGSVAADNWGVGFNAAALRTAADGMRATGYTAPIDYCTVFNGAFLPAGASSKLPVPCK